MNPSPILLYLRDCYQADRRGSTLWNIFDRRTEHRMVMRGREQLLNEFLPFLAVDAAKGTAAARAAQVYSKEKDLVYGALFISGSLQLEGGQTQAVCSPLFMLPARIREEDGQALLSIDPLERTFNSLLIDALCRDREQAASIYEDMLHAAPERIADFGAIHTVVRILEAALPDLDTEAVFRFPNLVAESTLRKYTRATDGRLRLLPASAVMLIPRSTETRGVLSELTDIADRPDLSAPLRLLLGGAAPPPPSTPVSIGRVPSVLSRAQAQVLEAAATDPLTLVIGPPGTGKSFTIASIALEHLSRGQSVLVVSRTNHAVDVIGNKIEHQLGASGCVIRGGRRRYLRDLKRSLDQMIHGILPDDPHPGESVRSWNRRLTRLDRRVRDLEQEFDRRNQWERKWGRFLAEEKPDVFRGIKSKYLDWNVSRQVLHADLLASLEQALEERIRVTVQSIQRTNRHRLESVLNRRRDDLVTFLKALRARRVARQHDLFAQVDFSVVLEAFPLWLVNLADLHKVLPLHRELFDLVVMDEATQCDMASALPAIQRARRAVIVGDPRQLRHLSFLSRKRQRSLARSHRLLPPDRDRLDYREASILDLVSDRMSSQRNVLFLNEHFRSLPPIIRFSNRMFYDDALRVMTHNLGGSRPPAIDVQMCGGVRDARGVNRREAEQIMGDVIDLVRQQDGLDETAAQSIGILSPFRDQVDHLTDRVNDMLSGAILGKHRVMIGTAHEFQGEERDVVFISLALDAGSHPAAFAYLNRADQFNVSITRARSRQRVYASVSADELDRRSLLAKYLEALTREAAPPAPRRPDVRERFLHDVNEALHGLGYSTWPAFIVAGEEIDLMVEHQGVVRGIDLIGYPGAFERAFSLERYNSFHRAGLRMLPLPYASWCLRRDDCLRSITATLS